MAAGGSVDLFRGVIVPYTNFALFVLALWYFARKPLAGASAARAEAFDRALKDASKAKEEAEAQLKALQSRLANLDKEIVEMREVSRRGAEDDAKRLIEDSKRLSEHMQAEARRMADAEVDNAVRTLRYELVGMVKEGVTQKLKTDFAGDEQASYIKKRIGALSKLKVVTP